MKLAHPVLEPVDAVVDVVERPGPSVWTYLEQGPALWRVRVERRA